MAGKIRYINQGKGAFLSDYSEGQIRAEGTVQDMPEISTWQYGEYLLVDDEGNHQYAFRANGVSLADYLGQRARVSGSLVEGHPVDGGPEFLSVGQIDGA